MDSGIKGTELTSCSIAIPFAERHKHFYDSEIEFVQNFQFSIFDHFELMQMMFTPMPVPFFGSSSA